MSGRPKNRSARAQQLARERARRQARSRKYPLLDFSPPFTPYSEWIHVPTSAKDMIEHPARYDDRVTDNAKDLADTLVKLGPRYHGHVPLAALYLDRQISEGTIRVAVTGRPGFHSEIPVTELADQLSTPGNPPGIAGEIP